VGYGKFKGPDWREGGTAAAPGVFFAGHYRDGISPGDSIVVRLRCGVSKSPRSPVGSKAFSAPVEEMKEKQAALDFVPRARFRVEHGRPRSQGRPGQPTVAVPTPESHAAAVAAPPSAVTGANARCFPHNVLEMVDPTGIEPATLLRSDWTTMPFYAQIRT